MSQEIARNGTIELRFNGDRTQALLNVFPSSGGEVL